ncbi:MAG: hypothetical protein A2270_05835 [Elusimicrobia bacterium RIFOXYA12_FULL_51_18]|nr:MAG: hypothetical protein A2270_05835 [Elusimicrobia bacterium RIFOXYA12_FULL_51_18]OGS29667.1 MAG: hypothetical protein A2218_03115 [Elusimicrobia bacterium RIFOXYA2_FULL_53_38]
MRTNNNRRDKRDLHDSAIELFDKAGNLIIVGKLVDFSMSGASFRAEQTLALGGQIRARLRLLEEGTLDISARVVWSREEPGTNLYGIKFDSIETVYPTGELKRPFT